LSLGAICFVEVTKEIWCGKISSLASRGMFKIKRILFMAQVVSSIEGTVSPKHQITIPSAMRDALGLRSGDKIEFKLGKGNVLELRVKRPTPSDTIGSILSQFDSSALESETGNNAAKSVRESRWDDR
jgi:AbrB family looped-hinge helix DNA binding protein